MDEEWEMEEEQEMDEDRLPITSEDEELLDQIEELGAASTIELAVKTLRQPEDVQPELKRLHEAGLVKTRRGSSEYTGDIYLLTREGRRYTARSRRRLGE